VRYSKFYEFVSPDGKKTIEFTTILDFCNKNGLRPDCMRRILHGKAKKHKGWTVSELSKYD
jgi:hypothetical protein